MGYDVRSRRAVGGDVVGDLLQRRVPGDLNQQLRVHRFHQHAGVIDEIGAHYDVAGQQQPDLTVDGHRAVGCLRGLQAPRIR